ERARTTGSRAVTVAVRRDDLTDPEVLALVAEHFADMYRNSPPGHAHALAIDGLRSPDVTFWTAWIGDTVCGCGALKEVDRVTGESKSMRTRRGFLRRGIAQAVLDRIIATACERGYERLV